MANLDSRFICVSDLELYMVDNSSGLPLSGGIVTFYSDVNRTVLKPVYQLTGSPGNYSYEPLNNPCTLSSAGTFQDGLGNNIVPYYYPFTGTPEENTGIQELYYVVVLNSGYVPQFVRQGWPQAAGGGTPPITDEEIDNFIPNGQFLAHNDIMSLTEPPIQQYTYGSQTVDAQQIAQGGWNFVYTDGTTATFGNGFSQIPSSGGWGINSFPKFAFNFVCTSFNANAQTRDLRIQWPDVNKFSSGNPPGSTPYTLFFDGKSNDGNTYVFNLYKVYYFGTGGSPSNPVEEFVGEVTIGPGMTFVSHNINDIVFSANLGTIGTNGDDYVALSLRGPASAWNVSVTDFLLAQGTEEFTSFPVMTNDQMLSRGVAGWMPTPNPDGSDLYLPLVLTPSGMTFDHSLIGTVTAKMTTSPVNNELLCDGTQYQTISYSSIGIPYSRLQKVLFSSTLNGPLFGTGSAWINTYATAGISAQLILRNNSAGAQAFPADSGGSTATGFPFVTASDNSGAANIGFNAYSNSSGNILAVSTFTNNPAAMLSPGTSGMAMFQYNQPPITGQLYAFGITALPANTLSAGSATPGLYFQFSNHSTSYYMWFKVNGETDPAPGGTGIVCNLLPGMTAVDVAIIIASTLGRMQSSCVTVTGQPANGAGSYFTFQSNSTNTAVWYQVAGAGSQPAGFVSYVMVPLTGTENAASVAFKTQTAINSAYFAVPDLRGLFLRGVDSASSPEWDIDVLLRGGIWNLNVPNSQPGSLEFMQIEAHVHSLGSTATALAASPGGGGSGASTGVTGGSETRPANMSVNYFIRY